MLRQSRVVAFVLSTGYFFIFIIPFTGGAIKFSVARNAFLYNRQLAETGIGIFAYMKTNLPLWRSGGGCEGSYFFVFELTISLVSFVRPARG